MYEYAAILFCGAGGYVLGALATSSHAALSPLSGATSCDRSILISSNLTLASRLGCLPSDGPRLSAEVEQGYYNVATLTMRQ